MDISNAMKPSGLHSHMMSLPAGRAALPGHARIFDPAPRPASEPQRRRIWELSGNFHCSIIGTCLTTGELRHLLVKMQLPGVQKESDHELHGRAVLIAGRKDQASKLLQKALDRQHRLVLNQFAKARDTDELRSF